MHDSYSSLADATARDNRAKGGSKFVEPLDCASRLFSGFAVVSIPALFDFRMIVATYA